MDKTALVEKQVEEGKLLLSELDKRKLDIKAAFWIYDDSYSSWKLMIASSSNSLDVKNDVLKAYGVLTEVIRSIPNLSTLSGSDVVLIPVDHPLIKNIAPLIETGTEIANITLSKTLVNEAYIEGMHLYRMNLK
jgi:hypothetical protein